MERPRILSVSSLLAERTMTGRFRFSRMRISAESPSSFGIITSIRMSRTAGSSACSTAPNPSYALRTVYPSRSSTMAIAPTISRSSSTTRIHSFIASSSLEAVSIVAAEPYKQIDESLTNFLQSFCLEKWYRFSANIICSVHDKFNFVEFILPQKGSARHFVNRSKS